MPTYAYACTACDHRFEAVQSFSDDSLTELPAVRGPAAQGVQRRRCRLQGLRLLPHRLRAAAPPPRVPGRSGCLGLVLGDRRARRPASSRSRPSVRGTSSSRAARRAPRRLVRLTGPPPDGCRTRDPGPRRRRPSPVHRAGRRRPAVHRPRAAGRAADDRALRRLAHDMTVDHSARADIGRHRRLRLLRVPRRRRAGRA